MSDGTLALMASLESDDALYNPNGQDKFALYRPNAQDDDVLYNPNGQDKFALYNPNDPDNGTAALFRLSSRDGR